MIEDVVTYWAVQGRKRSAPLADYNEALWQMLPGDSVMGFNRDHALLVYRIQHTRGSSPVNPYDKAREYKALARQHSNQFWSLVLAEAAEMIEALATDRITAERGRKPVILAGSENRGHTHDDPTEPPVYPGRRKLPGPRRPLHGVRGQ